MSRVYVVGHQKPDTDSICSAIGLSYLNNMLKIKSIPCRLGKINPETRYVLDYFNVNEPMLLEDVKVQIKDINYYRNYYVNKHNSIYDTFMYMKEKEVTGAPVVDDDKKLIGLVTNQRIIDSSLNNLYSINTSYNNLLNVLDGEAILKIDDEINGTLNKDIFIVKDDMLVSKIIQNNIKLLIVVGNTPVIEDYLNIARISNINIIRTSLDTYSVNKKLSLANYIYTVLPNENIETFNEEDYYDEFVVKTTKSKNNNYPVIGKNGKCLGLIRITDINNSKNRKKVILVDHNDINNSVEGLEEADILEIVDHHKIGNITTNNPINFRNEAVGSTCTIVYEMFNENYVDINPSIAGILLAGILSDTLILTSPTTTNLDKKAVEVLARKSNVDYKQFGYEMFRRGTTLDNKTIEEIVNNDIKDYNSEDINYSVSQVFTVNIDDILSRKDEYIEYIDRLADLRKERMILLVITDVVRGGSYLLYTKNSDNIVSDAFNIENIEEGVFVDGILSRKKQIIPRLIEVMR